MSDSVVNLKVHQIQSLTGIRFIAALWVVMFHIQAELAGLIPGIARLKPLFDQGHFAVPFFFILSGYILSHTYFTRYKLKDHPEFIWNRIARIWPVHLVTITLLIFYVLAVKQFGIRIETGNYSFPQLIPELLMIRGWTSDLLLWNYPAWSIQAEFFAYLFLFPLCHILFRQKWWISMSVFTPLLLLTIHGLEWHQNFQGRIGDIVLPFVAGSGIYALKQTKSIKYAGLLTYLAVGGIAFALYNSNFHSKSLVFCFFGLIIYTLSHEQGYVHQLLCHKWLCYGGRVSYSLYMTHGLVHIFYFFLYPQLPLLSVQLKYVVALVFMLGIAMTAVGFYHLVEIPCHRYLRRDIKLSGTKIKLPNCI